MSAASAPAPKFLSKGRSALSNGLTVLEGVDGRSTMGRRFRDLLKSLSADLGGLDSLGAGDLALVRQAAASVMRAEQLQAAIVRGERVDADELIRLSNTSRRLLSAIKRREPPKQKTLSDHLARKRGAAA